MRTLYLLAAAALIGVCACDKPKNTDKDNTAQNAAGGAGNHNKKTAGDQGENDVDRTITQEIRKAVVGDSDMSMAAKNVKIITSGGVVTLKGPVDSKSEKKAIEDKALKVAHVTRVDNQLEVKD